MITASKIAGYFAAHAIWCVSEDPILIPMLAYTTEDGERKMERFAGEDTAVCVAQAKQMLEQNSMDANDACLLYDGRITLGQHKVDAVIQAFFEGVEDHEQGSKVWNDSLDESK